MSGSLVFARWRQCAPHVMLPRVHPSPQPKLHLDRSSHFSRQCHRTGSGMPFPLKIAPCHGTIWTPSSTWFLLTTRVHTSNDISIGAAVFARPPNMDGSTVFARLCQCAPSCNTCFSGHTRVHNLNGISTGSAIFAQLTQSVVGHASACPFP